MSKGDLPEEVQELIELGESLEELAPEQRAIAEIIIRVDHRVDIETIDEMIIKLDRYEAVGPLLDPTKYRRQSGKNQRSLERLRAFKEFKHRLTEINND